MSTDASSSCKSASASAEGPPERAVRCRALATFVWRGETVRANEEIEVSRDDVATLFRAGVVVLAE